MSHTKETPYQSNPFDNPYVASSKSSGPYFVLETMISPVSCTSYKTKTKQNKTKPRTNLIPSANIVINKEWRYCFDSLASTNYKSQSNDNSDGMIHGCEMTDEAAFWEG